jgi:hypothetical protein
MCPTYGFVCVCVCVRGRARGRGRGFSATVILKPFGIILRKFGTPAPQHSKSKTISDFTVSRTKTHFMSLQEAMYNKTNGTASGIKT